MTREDKLASHLSKIVKQHPTHPGDKIGWDEDFGGLTVHREKNFVELSWSDSGVGEEYVMDALRSAWPDSHLNLDIDGGCDSCGYGRHLSLTVSGVIPDCLAASP